MKTKLILLTAALGLAAVSGRAQVGTGIDLVGWDTVNGTTVAATDLNTLIDGGSLARNGNLAQASGGDFNTSSWDDEAAGDFLSWSLDVDSGYQLDNLVFTSYMDRSNTGPSSITVLWSTDGFSTAGQSLGLNGVDVGSSGSVQTSSSFGTALTGTVSFRLIGTGATSGGGTFDFETNEVGPGTAYGMFVSGDVSVIPEPTSIIMVALTGLAAFGILRNRKK